MACDTNSNSSVARQERRDRDLGVPSNEDAAQAVYQILLTIESASREKRGPTDFDFFTIEELERHTTNCWDIMEDPVGLALRAGLKQLGRRLGRIKTFEDMETIADIAAMMDDGDWFQRRISVITWAWDGMKSSDGATWYA